MASGIEIPEKGIDYYTVKNVPHGAGTCTILPQGYSIINSK
jgi:hypothetical protein